jgi:hypothetical protein
MADTSRNRLEDWARFFLALMIVLAHLVLLFIQPGIRGTLYYLYANGITRAALPIFFAFSGFRIPSTITFELYKKRALRILKLFVVWQIIYSYFPIRDFLASHSVVELLENIIHGYWSLWYLAAVLFALTMLYALSKRFSRSQILLISISLYLIGYTLQILVNAGVFDSIPSLVTIYRLIGTSRNGLFFGLFFIAMGWTMTEWEKYIRKNAMIIVIVVSVVFLLGEALIYQSLFRKNIELCIFTVPITVGLLYFIERSPAKKIPAINPNLSIGIYLIHVLAMRVCFYIGLDRSIVTCCVVTLAITFGLFFICSRVKMISRLLF